MSRRKLVVVACFLLVALGATTDVRGQQIRRVVELDGVPPEDAAVSDDGSVVLATWKDGLWRWNPPATTPVEIMDQGFPARPSIADDGASAAIATFLDPLGLNADGSVEVFLVSTADGTASQQLTSLPIPAWYPDLQFALSGNAARFTYSGPFDPVGMNAGLVPQVFLQLILAGPTRQVTSFTDGTIEAVAISDDGNQLAFVHEPAGGGPQAYYALAPAFAPVLLGDGKNVAISGNGNLIAYEDFSEIFAYDHVLQTAYAYGPGRRPSIADDGTVWFDRAETTNDRDIVFVLPGSSVPVPVFDQAGPIFDTEAVVSGDGTRVVYFTEYGSYPGVANDDGSMELVWAANDGSMTTQLTDESLGGRVGTPSISADGTRVAFLADQSSGLYVVEPDGFGLRRLTFGGGVENTAISPDGQTVVFRSTRNLLDDPMCTNSPLLILYSVGVDGSGLDRLRPCDESPSYFDVHAAGIVAETAFPHTIRTLATDGTELSTVDTGANPSFEFYDPRVDGSGVWAAFKVQTIDIQGQGSQIWRGRLDGTLSEQLTADPSYFSTNGPDISADGNRIVFESQWDPLGTNTDHNDEIFLIEYPGGTITQLTDTTWGQPTTVRGPNFRPQISGNGEWVWFGSYADFFGSTEFQLYRLEIASGTLERVQGLFDEYPGGCEFMRIADEVRPCLTVDSSGHRGAIATWDPLDGQPQTGNVADLYLVEFDVPAVWTIPAGADTDVAFTADPRYLTYDVLRGDVASLGFNGGTIDLGNVVCLESGSTDTTADGLLNDNPAPGQVFFFLYRGHQGPTDPGSWGSGSGGDLRVPASGDCL